MERRKMFLISELWRRGLRPSAPIIISVKEIVNENMMIAMIVKWIVEGTQV